MIFHGDVQTCYIYVPVSDQDVGVKSESHLVKIYVNTKFFGRQKYISVHRVNVAKEVKVDTGPHLWEIYFFSFNAIEKLVLKVSSIPQ